MSFTNNLMFFKHVLVILDYIPAQYTIYILCLYMYFYLRSTHTYAIGLHIANCRSRDVIVQ